jgi:hypothetical protein
MFVMQTKAKFAADLSKRQKRRREISRVTERERRDEAAKAYERAEFIAALRTATVDLHGPRPGQFHDATTTTTDDNNAVDTAEHDDDDSTVIDNGTTAAAAIAVAASQMETFARILNRAPSTSSGNDFPALSAPSSATKSTNNNTNSSTNTPQQQVAWGKAVVASPVLTPRERESEFLMELTLTNSNSNSSKKGKKKDKGKALFSNAGARGK